MSQSGPDHTGLRALVVGQGSIGRRHARLLAESGGTVALVSAHAAGAFRTIADVPELESFDYAVIANDTASHESALVGLAAHKFAGRILVEKPLFAQVPAKLPPVAAERVRVGYNLRLNPVVESLRGTLLGRKIVAVRMHVGQYLPDWRPGTDFQSSASAKLHHGGGALRDLSHELDLMQHLFGGWRRLVALRPPLATLHIETDEAWSILFELTSGAAVTLTLNYHDQPAERRCVVTTDAGTVSADLIKGVVREGADERRFDVARDDTYRRLHRRMLDKDDAILCTLEQGLAVVETIAAIERSSAERTWVQNV